MQPKYQATVELNDAVHRLTITFARPMENEFFSHLKSKFEAFEGFYVNRGANMIKGGVAANIVNINFNKNYDIRDVAKELAKFLQDNGYTKLLFERDVPGDTIRGTLEKVLK